MTANTKLRPGSRIQVTVDRLAVGGKGVCRHEGLVIFVSDVVPGELVEVEITKAKKNFAEGRLTKVLSPSPSRVVPPCKYVGRCGGCSWQHLAYSEQLKWKKELVAEALEKFSGFKTTEIRSLVADTLPSPNEFRYRNRIQIHIDRERLGFHERSSQRIVNIDDCLITESALTEMFAGLKTSARRAPSARMELFVGESGRAAIRGTEGSDDETAFSQVNTAQNARLIEHVVQMIANEMATTSSHRIFDLYAGNGNFTFPLAQKFPHAIIASAELNPRSVRHAQQQAKAQYPDLRLRIEEADVGEFLAKEKNLKEAIVLLDPPRVGCQPNVIAALERLAPKTIVYVSCHPVTLARDLRPFSEHGYQLVSIQPVDMFPQTDHVETVVVLRQGET